MATTLPSPPPPFVPGTPPVEMTLPPEPPRPTATSTEAERKAWMDWAWYRNAQIERAASWARSEANAQALYVQAAATYQHTLAVIESTAAMSAPTPAPTDAQVALAFARDLVDVEPEPFTLFKRARQLAFFYRANFPGA